ncbi:hypothetical protein [Mangrovimonas sp. DI 80]|uniref:hypothetical protein n=1 Tax=Mangrovimonas sp. DI 80 TaxID=1779330 RepID=UPI0009D11EFA|nr:hypothetical protein [Mangrovimonas sp. DI 80]OMP29941.1 hypothetical protein BKM32_15165 [Mangrovimonas sp. DI 80]
MKFTISFMVSLMTFGTWGQSNTVYYEGQTKTSEELKKEVDALTQQKEHYNAINIDYNTARDLEDEYFRLINSAIANKDETQINLAIKKLKEARELMGRAHTKYISYQKSMGLPIIPLFEDTYNDVLKRYDEWLKPTNIESNRALCKPITEFYLIKPENKIITLNMAPKHTNEDFWVIGDYNKTGEVKINNTMYDLNRFEYFCFYISSTDFSNWVIMGLFPPETNTNDFENLLSHNNTIWYKNFSAIISKYNSINTLLEESGFTISESDANGVFRIYNEVPHRRTNVGSTSLHSLWDKSQDGSETIKLYFEELALRLTDHSLASVNRSTITKSNPEFFETNTIYNELISIYKFVQNDSRKNDFKSYYLNNHNFLYSQSNINHRKLYKYEDHMSGKYNDDFVNMKFDILITVQIFRTIYSEQGYILKTINP